MGTIGYGEALSWSPIQEETLFSNDGLNFVVNLTEIPRVVQALESSICQRDGVVSDLNSTEFSADATAKELQDLFVIQTSPYARYFRYRQNALESLWRKREELKNCSPKSSCDTKVEQLLATVAKPRVGFSSRVSLLLLIPLIKSHSKTDPSLAESSTEILFQCLKDCSPNSLGNEPLSCVTGLADLLTGWLAVDLEYEQSAESSELENACAMEKERNKTVVRNETVIGCLLSLSCARMSLRLFVKTLVMLQQSKDRLGMLPLANVLKNTVQYERCGWKNNPSVMLASNLKSTWKYCVDHPVCMKGNVITCDGKYLYILHGSCMVKLGSGKHNTIRGHVYTWNTNFPEGFLCFVGGKLVFRSNISEETYVQKFAEVIDTETLKICSPIEYSSNNHSRTDVPSRKTVNIVTDGVLLYWIYYHDASTQTGSPHGPVNQSGSTSGSRSTSSVVEVYLEVLELKQSGEKCIATCVHEPVVLKFREEAATSNSHAEFPIPLAMRPVTVAQPTHDENSKTSCGMTINLLQRTPIFTDGTYLIMVIGHPNYHGYPVSKAPFNRCYSIVEGKFVKDVNLIDVPKAENPKWQSVSLADTGICYDHVNNQIWTSSEDCIEEWLNVGALSYHHVAHKLAHRFPDNLDMFSDDDMISPSDCMTATAMQISFLCSAVSRDVTKPLIYDLTLDDEYQQHVLGILDCAVRQQDQCVLHAALILIQTLFSKAYTNNSKLDDGVVASIRLLIWKVICCDIVELSEKVRQEACHTLRSCLGIFYPILSEQSAVMMILFNEPEENGIVYLKDVLLRDFTEALMRGPPSDNGCVGWFAEDVVFTIINRCTAESCYLISLAKEGKTKDYQFPCISPLLGYLKAMITKTLEELYLGHEATFHGDVEDLFERLVAGFKEVSKVVLDVLTSIDAKSTPGFEETLSLLHNATKSSMFEQVMPIFLTALSGVCNLSICKLLAAPIMELTVTLTKIASLHRKLCPLRHGSSKNPSQVRCFLQSSDKDTKKPFDKVFIPKPWLGPQTISSMHPVCDEYKTQRTVSLFGAKTLYLKFDERCATQYDYDKLVVYAGANSSFPKVGEYGGNSFGYGGRSVVKTGWPKDLVKVNGDTVTLCLEVKSTRERATPDKAVWGFTVIIAAEQEYFKDKNKCIGGLDLFTDVALAGSYFTYNLLNMMYCGPLPTEVELRCSHLLKSKLLQRCVWKDSLTMIQDSPKTTKDSNTSSKLSANVLDKLRTCCSSQRPTLRPSIQNVVKPLDVETLIVGATVKHYGLTSCVNKFELATGNLSRKKEFCSLLDVAEEVFFKVDSLVRQLQAMAELEKKWWQDLMDICREDVQPSAAFFNDYHLQEDKAKVLELLCSLKTVQFDPLDHEKSVGRLIQILETESRVLLSNHHSDDDVSAIFPRTNAYVSSVMERAELLLNVTIVGSSPGPAVGRSASNIDETITGKGSLSSEPDGMVTRSVSAPHLQQPGSEQFVQGLEDLQRFRRWDQTLRNLHKMSRGSEHRECLASVVEQIFTFVAGSPDEAVSCGSFLSAARTRWRRGKYRQLAILHMNKLATISATLGVTGIHLLGVVVSIMSQGTKLHDLECSGMLNDVRDEYGMLLRHIVDQSVGMLARYCEKLIILATTPFTLCERQDVLRSSLILMINKLCSSSNLDTGLLDLTQRNYAWRSFQVLIDRLVTWESETAYDPEEIEWSGVARQVATVLTSYLRYLENKVSKHDVVTRVSDPLHEVLELLQRISGSHLGECVLSQPHMIKILLSVITDRQASPKHVLTALTLLYSALPLTDPDTDIPLTSPSMEALPDRSTATSQRKPSYAVIKVLLNKLGELLLPYNSSDDAASSTKRQRRSNGYGTSVFSVYVHNRGDIATHEIVQKVLSSSGQPFLFQVGLGSQMERAITLNRELSENGFAEVLTDKMSTCLKQATRLAQSGICVSISSPQDVKGMLTESSTDSHTPEAVCQERNKNLVGFGNTRPYVSGNVAHNMASEVVALLRNLMQVNSAWASTVKDVLMEGLDDLSSLVQRLNDTYETDETDWHTMAQQVLATLCTLGGFKETVRPGCTAVITAEGLLQSKCRVLAISSEHDTAQIIIEDVEEIDESFYVSKHPSTVPLNVLSIPREQVLPFTDTLLQEKLIAVTGKVLQDNTTMESLGTLFANNDSDLEILRILAEVKTRVFALLDVYLEDQSAAQTILEMSPELLGKLLTLARSLDPGERQVVMENHCEELRALFKEYVRPVHHEVSTEKRRSNMPGQFDITREFPIVFGCVFSRELTCAHYVCDPVDNASSKQPRGALVFADKPFPERASSYYWEADIVSLGEGENCDSGPFLSFGFMPNCSPSDTAWNTPVGSCLIHSTGRAIHYQAGGPLSSSSVTLNLSMREHDVIGCGWERLDPTEIEGNSCVTGRVYFTRNGKRLAEVLDGVSTGLFPVVHIQKKNIRVLVNLGSRTFRYHEANNQRSSEESLQSLSMEEVRANLAELPFCDCSESDEQEEIVDESRGGADSREQEGPLLASGSSERTDGSPNSSTKLEEQEYDCNISQLEFLSSSYDLMLDNGPAKYMTPDDDETNCGHRKPRQFRKDPRSLLVKAWESKVFPTIRRRFRSEADRRSGLEQIRGALMEGLIDIAISTVEDLYEDSGGLPNSLTFPRIEDIEAELDKTTVQDLRQAMTVQIVCSSIEALPEFAVPAMRKTFGLCGVVQEIDKRQELALVDVYIRDEGSVVRYWYPVHAVKPQPPAFGRLSSLTFVDQEKASFEIYTELWNCENTLTRMYGRSAAIKLLDCKRQLLMEKQGIADVETTLEEISLLTGHHLRDPQSDGSLTARYIATTSSLKECLKITSCSPLAVFFKDEQTLRSHFSQLVLSLLTDDAKVKDVCEKLCTVLKDYSVLGSHERHEVSNVKLHKDVHYQNSAMTSVSCFGTADYFMPRIRVPCVEIFGYYGRRRLTKDGNVDKYKLTHYPDFAGHPVNVFGDGKNCLNPERFLPANRFHLRLGSSNAKGIVLRLNGLPQELLLCLSFIETLLDIFSRAAMESNLQSSESEEFREPACLGEILELLQRFLVTTTPSPFVRELIFHLLAQVLRLLGKTASTDRLQFYYEASSSFLASLKSEVFKLMEKEVSVSRANALEYVLNCNFEKVKFSSYLQSLLEVVLATVEVQRRIMGTEWDLGDSPRQKSTVWDTPSEDVTDQPTTQDDHESSAPVSTSSNLSIEVYQGGGDNPGSFIPFFASLPVMNENQRLVAVGEAQPARAVRAQSLRRQRFRERKKRNSKKASSQDSEARSEEERLDQTPPWYKKLVNTLAVLRHLVRNESCGKSAALDALGTSLAFPSMAWDRVIVVTNIPSSISDDIVIQAITKAARSAGGVLPDGGIYLQDELVITRPRGDEETGNQSSGDQSVQSYKSAVVQLRTSLQIDRIRQRLQQEKALTAGNSSAGALQILKVNKMLLFDGGWAVTKSCQAWESFLQGKLLNSSDSLTPATLNALKEIFLTCHVASRITVEDKVTKYKTSRVLETGDESDVTELMDTSSILLSAHAISEPNTGNLMYTFLKILRERTKLSKEELLDIIEQYGRDEQESGQKLLYFEGFLNYVKQNIKNDKRLAWKAFQACGYDFNHQRSTEIFPFEVEREHEKWSLDDDKTLIIFIDDISKNLSASPQRLNAEEIFLESDLINPCFASLKQFSRRSIGSRFALHKYLNMFVQSLVLPAVDLRVSRTHSLSTASLLTSAKDLLFRNTKISELNRVLDLSAQRSADDPSPEISLDPLESIEASKVADTGPQVYQVACQLSKVASSKLRVKVATGGDPSFPLRVNLRGEQVLGLGGAYRHFMWIMAREVQSSHLGLFIPCPSAAANRNKGKYILRPGPMTLSERQILVFFGQLLGIALRSDIPLALDILPSFWKSILGLPLDEIDLHDADILTYYYIRRLSEISLKEDFERLCMEADISGTRFVFTSLNGEEVPLCPNGNDLLVSWENRLEYAKAVLEYRLQELSCEARVRAIKTGLATVVPVQVLTILNPSDLEIRTCGIPNVDIDFLKMHTTYVAGIRPTDRHIEYFWNALESFSKDEQRKFIKFACNQERLPGRCSCQDGSTDIHVPPYPMKIGPPDGRGPPDLRYIRVETCMFMVKLPRYTTQNVMREKLLYAINCREDPLTDFR